MESAISLNIYAGLKAVSQRGTKSYVRGFGEGVWQGWWREKYIFPWKPEVTPSASAHIRFVTSALPKSFLPGSELWGQTLSPVPSTGNKLCPWKSWLNKISSPQISLIIPLQGARSWPGHQQVQAWPVRYKKTIGEVNVIRPILSMKKWRQRSMKFSYFSAGYLHAFGIYHNLIYFMFSWLFIAKWETYFEQS